jgi:hypothetical protein
MQKSKKHQSIPTTLTEPQFNEFVLPYLTKGSRGPNTKISFYRIFNYILKLMHTGCQWYELAIERDASGKPEIQVLSHLLKSFVKACKIPFKKGNLHAEDFLFIVATFQGFLFFSLSDNAVCLYEM